MGPLLTMASMADSNQNEEAEMGSGIRIEGQPLGTAHVLPGGDRA
jgi:hypothetical protein